MIEKYQPGDFEELFALNNLCYGVDERPNRAEFESMVKSSEVWIERSCVIWPDCSKPEIISGIIINEHVARHPYLWSLFVRPRYQGDGHGKKLLALACDRYPKMELHCRVDNPAQKLYFDHGFRVVEVVRDWYVIDGKKVAGLKMRRET